MRVIFSAMIFRENSRAMNSTADLLIRLSSSTRSSFEAKPTKWRMSSSAESHRTTPAPLLRTSSDASPSGPMDSKGVELVWYVIQVINGREDVMRERIERMVPAVAMQELFYPQFQTEIKVHGEWVNTTKPLFPGYLICDTADPRTVQQYLLRMDDFARVLSQDGQFVPLAKEEVQLIGGFTHRGDRVVPMSEALKDGDQVVVTAGPLLGHEGLIKTINRRKSTAYLELNLCGRRVTTRVGLAVLSAEQRVMRNLKKAIA